MNRLRIFTIPDLHYDQLINPRESEKAIRETVWIIKQWEDKTCVFRYWKNNSLRLLIINSPSHLIWHFLRIGSGSIDFYFFQLKNVSRSGQDFFFSCMIKKILVNRFSRYPLNSTTEIEKWNAIKLVKLFFFFFDSRHPNNFSWWPDGWIRNCWSVPREKCRQTNIFFFFIENVVQNWHLFRAMLKKKRIKKSSWLLK